MRLLFVLARGKVVPFDRFLTEAFGTDSSRVAKILNDMLRDGHATFGAHGDDLVLQITEEGEAWVAEGVKHDPGAVAATDQLDADLRDSAGDDDRSPP
jgi:hypothetical protein